MDTIHDAIEAVRVAMVHAQADGDEKTVRQLLRAAQELIKAKRVRAEQAQRERAS